MSGQYPPTRSEYVASVRHQAVDLGGALGMAAAVVAVSLSGMPINYLSMMTAPFALFVGAAVGMGVMAVGSTVVASAMYPRRYRKEFAQARELAAALAEDPQMTSASLPSQQPVRTALLPPPALMLPPPEPRRAWTEMFAPREDQSFAQRLADARAVEEFEQRLM